MKQKPLVEIHMIVWNRLLLTKLTLDSAMFSLRQSNLNIDVKIFDQKSKFKTRKFLTKLTNNNINVIFNSENIGMARAWKYLSSESNADYILTLENDWFCDSSNSNWLHDAIEILEDNPNVAFVKLRKLRDRDDWGWGKIEYSPWSLNLVPDSDFRIRELSNGKQYYLVSPSRTSFTFNPVLMRREFRDELDSLYLDDPQNPTPLRSGEDAPSEYWRKSKIWWAATLTDGPFRHIGFYGRFNKLFIFNLYRIKYVFRRILFPK